MPGPMFAAGDSVTLRTIEEGDLEFLAAARNDPAIRRPLTVNRPSNGEQTRGFFEDAISTDDGVNLLISTAEEGAFAIDGGDASADATRETDAASADDVDGVDDAHETDVDDADGDDSDADDRVGMVSLFDEDDIAGTATVAYWVVPDEQGNGYCTEAVGLLCEHAFADRRLHKLRADVLATNDGSRRLLEKLGFAEEGLLRDEKFVYGDYVDVHRYGLLADDWEGV